MQSIVTIHLHQIVDEYLSAKRLFSVVILSSWQHAFHTYNKSKQIVQGGSRNLRKGGRPPLPSLLYYPLSLPFLLFLPPP